MDFVHDVESGMSQLDSSCWLTSETVRGLTDLDFVTLPASRREELFRCAAEFGAIARTAPHVDSAEAARARAALETLATILQPYLTPESRKIGAAIWRVWKNDRERIPTFDYELEESWTGSPIVWVWLILRDDLDVEAPATRELLGRVRVSIRNEFERAGIDRWPNIGVRTESDVRELVARAVA